MNLVIIGTQSHLHDIVLSICLIHMMRRWTCPLQIATGWNFKNVVAGSCVRCGSAEISDDWLAEISCGVVGERPINKDPEIVLLPLPGAHEMPTVVIDCDSLM